jgi:hypothetical protein
MNALEGIWERALQEWKEYQESGEYSKEPEHLFCMGYVFGCGLGLALSTVRPELVSTFEPIYRERGWLKGHKEIEGGEKRLNGGLPNESRPGPRPGWWKKRH